MNGQLKVTCCGHQIRPVSICCEFNSGVGSSLTIWGCGELGTGEGKRSLTCLGGSCPCSVSALPHLGFFRVESGATFAPQSPYIHSGSRAMGAKVPQGAREHRSVYPTQPWPPETLFDVALCCPDPMAGQGQCRASPAAAKTSGRGDPTAPS